MRMTKKQIFENIAKKELGFTLKAQNSDSLDFHTRSIWSIEGAMEAVWNIQEKKIKKLRKELKEFEDELYNRDK